jgi:hypothetical protein
VDPAPLRLLLGGRLLEAAHVAMRRLVPGRSPGPDDDAAGDGDAGDAGDDDQAGRVADSSRLARRLAASLCFPIDTAGHIDAAGECSDIARLRRALLVFREHAGARILELGPHTGMENP